ncbi:MAG: insulinase family protein [Elusimicrobia bacterium]|nr:insulinase family protein [Elusimicrobiota bacterium]
MRKGTEPSPLETLKKAATKVAMVECCALEGVPCCLMWHGRSPSVTVAYCFHDGVAYEPRERWGVSHLLEHCMLKGTQNLPSLHAVSRRVESAGGNVSAFSTRDMTVFWVKVPAGHEDLALEVLTEVVARPLLDEAAVKAEKAIIGQERLREASNLGRHASTSLEGMLLEPSPLSRHPVGSEESLAALDSDALRAHLEGAYGRRNMVVAAAGGLSSKFRGKLRCALAALRRASPAARPAFEVSSPLAGCREALRGLVQGPRPRSSQAYLSLGWRFPVKDRGELMTWRVVNSLLGVGYTSLLNQALRERENLAYLCTTTFNEYQGTGVLKVNTAVPGPALGKAVDLVGRVVQGLREGCIDEAAFGEAAIRHYAALVYRLEDSLDAAKLLGASLAREGRPFSAGGYLEELSGAAPRRACELAARHLVAAARKAFLIADPQEALKVFPGAKVP